MAAPRWDELKPAAGPDWGSLSTAPPDRASPGGGKLPADPREEPADWREGSGILAVLNRADRLGGRAINRIARGVGLLGRDAFNAIGLDGVASEFGRQAEIADRFANAPVKGAATWDEAKANPLTSGVQFVAEQGLGGLPDMGAAVLAPWAYGASRTADIADQRAKNDGRSRAGALDYAIGAPAAALGVAGERFGFHGITNPVTGGIVRSLGNAAAREAGQEAVQSGAEYLATNAGTRAGMSWDELGDQMLQGAVVGGPFGAAAHGTVAAARRLRPGEVDVPEADLVNGSLDGGVASPFESPDVLATLQEAGVSPDQFTSPEVAARMAERVAAARQRPVNVPPDELQRQRGILDMIAMGETDPAWAPAPPPRVLPEGVTIAAAPEGLIRSDDLGGGVGLERKRGADANVLETARQQAENDPILREILGSSLSPDAKVGAALGRLQGRLGTSPDMPPLPPEWDGKVPGVEPVSPYQAPTPEQARTAPVAGGRAAFMARVRGAESGGDDNAANPRSSASGRYQFTDGTWRALGGDPRLKNDPREQERLMAKLTDQNEAGLRKAGVPLTAGNYYLAHFAGIGGATKLHSAAPGTPVEAVLGRDVVEANPFLRGKSAGETIAWAASKMGERAPAAPFRMSAPDGDTIGGRYDGASEPLKATRADPGFEDTTARTSATNAEREAGTDYTAPQQSGGSDRPFRATTDDPEGQPGFWEDRSRKMAADAQAKREAELEEEWARRRAEEAAGRRQQRERAGGEDPSTTYGRNAYEQKPHQEGGFWRRTQEGFIAGKDGKPVAFRNAKEAARWAAKNEMGGDFELHSWGANSNRIVLKQREGSTYGQAQTPTGPAEPAAGRSTDTSQRMIGAMRPEQPGSASSEQAPPLDADGPRLGEEGLPTSDNPPPPTEEEVQRGLTFDRYRPTDPGREPRKPRDFLQTVAGLLKERSKGGTRVRINAEDAISYGVPADQIYVDPRAKHPVVKLRYQGVFSSSKAPLNSKALPTKIVSLDDLGDRFDPRDFGLNETGERPDPEQIGQLLGDAINGDEAAWDRSDPRHEEYNTWREQQAELDAFERTYGADWHRMSDQELDRIDAEHEAALDAMFDRVVSFDQRFDPEDPFNYDFGEAERGPSPEGPGAESGSREGGSEPPRSGVAEGGRGSDPSADFFGERPGDRRRALERQTEGRLRSDKPQKAPGSDGGLFDTRETTRTLGDLWNDESGSLNLDAILDTDGLTRDAERLRRAVGSPAATVKKVTEPMGRVISAAMFTNDARVRALAERFDSDALREYADLWHSRAGKADGTGRTYHEAIAREATLRTQKVHDALEPFLGKPASLDRIRDLLATPNRTVRATQEERDAAVQLRELLKDTIRYRKEAGEDVGEVGDGYFPRHLNVDAVAKNPDDFLRKAEQLYRGLDVADPKSAAKAWLGHVLDTYAGLDGAFGQPGVNSSRVDSSKSREFGKQADILLKDFYSKDVFGTLADYMAGAVRSAEYARRFGREGAEGSVARKAWIDEHGTERTKLDVLLDRIKADVRGSEKDPAGVLSILDSVHRSNLGQMGSKDPFVRTATSYLHAWNQIAKMDRTLVTSLGELTMGLIRGGPKYGFSYLKTAGSEFVRQLRNADPSDAARWAEAVGVANDAMVNQILHSRIDAESATAGTQKVLASYYRGIGLHQYTEATRIAAVKIGRHYLDTLAGDLESKSARTRNRADRYLRELGIKDPKAFGKILRERGFTLEEVSADKGPAADYGTALMRFVNQTIMMPSRAEKPTWAAHPVGSLVFSLMGYSYGFKKNVLDRAGRLAIDGVRLKDPALLIPALSLTVMAAFQGLNDTYLRPFLFGSSYDFSKETPTETMLRVVDRAGFTGGLSPVVNAVKAVRYDRDLATSLSGPVAGTLLDAGQKIFVDPFSDSNSKNTNTAERNAAGALYDVAIEPALDAFAAARLLGPVKTGAIMATGNREGGVLPGDRSAFVDEVGGEKAK